MPYFRYSFLNGLRDELYLTQTRQKVTLIAFLYVLIPVVGAAIGSAWVSGTHMLEKSNHRRRRCARYFGGNGVARVKDLTKYDRNPFHQPHCETTQQNNDTGPVEC